MNVIEKNTEKKLYKDLKACWEKYPANRCLHLKLSQIDADFKEWRTDLLDTLKEYFDDANSQVYVCHDKDVFILHRQLTQKSIADLFAHLSPKLPPAPMKGLAALFEIGKHWPRLRTICQKKIENLELLKQQRQKTKTEEIEFVSRDEALKTINRDLVSSLAMRRDMRSKAEIMVVEDDPLSQRLVSNALKGKYEPSITGDGQGAIMSYINKAPDVLFLDIGLPDIDGHEVLEKLFQYDPDAYVVMFSGNGDKDNILKAIELGAKGFVGKPFTADKLFQYIEKSPFIQAKQKREIGHGDRIH